MGEKFVPLGACRPIIVHCVTVLAFLALIIVPARAEEGGTLLQVMAIAEAPDSSYFRLDFSPKVSSFSAADVEPSRPALSFANTSRAQGAVTPRGLKGFVRSLEFEQNGADLVVRFNVNAPAKFETEIRDGKRLLVTVRKRTGRDAGGPAPTASADRPPEAVTRTTVPKAVDAPPGEGFELIMLKYADVSEIVGLLTEGATIRSNNVFIRREPGFGLPNANGSNYNTAAATEQDDKPMGQSVDSSIAVNRRLNAIWIKGSPQRIARVKEQIALIDVPVDSVVLETQFVELTETGARNVGIDFANANGQLAVGTFQTGQFVPFGFGTNPLDSVALQAALYAQIEAGEGKIVSKPRIAAQSGSTAKIITGDALPILTAITLSGVNGVSQQVQYVNVGVTLQIAPRVSPDGYVTSHIYGVVSSVTGFSQGYPTISQREAETSASVMDGETFVIGGLTLENVLRSDSKVPVLGDIPLLGELFSHESSSVTKTELYIIITPRIVRHRRPDVIDGNGSTGGVPLQMLPQSSPAPSAAGTVQD